MHPSKQDGTMSAYDEACGWYGYVFSAMRTCSACRSEFRAVITIYVNRAGVVWRRYEPTCCPKCLEGDK